MKLVEICSWTSTIIKKKKIRLRTSENHDVQVKCVEGKGFSATSTENAEFHMAGMGGFFTGSQTLILSFGAKKFSKPQAFLGKKHNGNGVGAFRTIFTSHRFEGHCIIY